MRRTTAVMAALVLMGALAPASMPAEASASVTVCHKGREISVSPAAVPAHLLHGDTLGACGDDGSDPGDPGGNL